MKNYTPTPIDTTNVTLPESILLVAEKLAKNTHENWSVQRMSDGWKYGPHRCDSKKEHPCLVPYEELSEEEKKYDRNTSIETLKCIIALGYEIRKLD